MYESKMVKSALRSNKASDNKFVPLLKIHHDKVYPQQEGIRVLKKLTSGSLVIVAFEQAETELPFFMFECSELNNARNEAGIWISQNVVEDDDFGVKIVGLVGFASTTQDLMRVHMFSSILASVVVVNVYPGFSGFRFLKSIEGRVSFSKGSRNNLELKDELANLVILQRNSNANTSLTNDQGRIESIERQQNLSDMDKMYRSVSFFEFPKDQELRYNQKGKEDLHTKLMELHLSFPREEKRLEYGPVLAEYLPEIIKEYNSRYSICYKDALKRIEIDDGYEAYMEALTVYNDALRRKFSGNHPIRHPENDLKDYRREAVSTYKRRTDDMQFLEELNDTIDDKEEKALRINDQMWQEQNFDILKKESRALVNYSENKHDTTFDVKREVERINEVYNSKAGGRTKDEDFNRFLEKLNETLGEDNYDKNIKISRLERDNKKLEERLKKMEKKGCCEIM